jgi:signal transduction histidine kinase/ActR/RegA family two-component response regulator
MTTPTHRAADDPAAPVAELASPSPKEARLSRLHTSHVPRLRAVGLAFMLATVALYNLVFERQTEPGAWLVFGAAAAVYAIGSWAILRRWYRPEARPDLALVFLIADLVPMTAAVYLTGADRSWIFWIFLLRVADQSTTRFRRAMGFSFAGVGAYLALVAYVAVVEGRPVEWPVEAAKLTFLLLSGVYVSLGARLTERLRARLGEALREARRSADELQNKSRQLDRARVEAEAGSRAKTEFLSRVSHELRTPMNAIMGFGQLLELENLSTEQRAYVGEILDSGRHLLDVINEVLDIARVESGSLAPELGAVHLGDALDYVLDQFRQTAELSRVTLPSELTPRADVWVRGSERKVRQVFANLVSNAIRYNNSPGRVDLDVGHSGGRVRVSITDTGPGLEPDTVEAAFAPFARLDTAGNMAGTGLGLAVARSLTTAMGGQIGVDTRPGEGSTFWVELEEAAAPESIQEAEMARSAERSGSGPLVLYIEDRPENVTLMRRILARRPAVNLISATGGMAGLDAARSERPDLILLDLELPDVDGAEVLARLREDPETRVIPVVVVSAEAAPGNVERLLAAGARAYFTMPYDVVDFLDSVDQALTPA